MKEKYIAIIPSDTNYSISEDFATLEEAVKYGIANNYGRGFEIAKRVKIEFKEKLT